MITEDTTNTTSTMSNEWLKDELNDAQQAAVTAPLGHQLVLAGAGSGKTRVLVCRIAWVLLNHSLSPFNILAVTFTNKAAGEMSGRIASMVNEAVRGMWVGTFHHLAHRLLRMHWNEAKLAENFQIIDSDDQLRLVKRIVKSMNLSDNKWAPKKIQWFINGQKDLGLRAKDCVRDNFYQDKMIDIYYEYETLCEQNDLVDFSELLLRSFELLRNNPDLLQHYQQRFKHVFVDEFQDTNSIQYEWIKLFCGPDTFITVVGDDDQSIYGWRGAKVENIQRFTREFSNVTVYRLEQNYRSTAIILKAANALIANNDNRLGKELWTQSNPGEPIPLYAAYNEQDEANYIVNCVKDWVHQGGARKEISVLYRSNAQSRALEEALLHHNIPYRIYGGVRFFERAEIKDSLAYLRLVTNRNDDTAFERVINTPTRGIGARSLEIVREHARTHQLSLWQASCELIHQADSILKGKARNGIAQFCEIINAIEDKTINWNLADQVDFTLKHSGLYASYEQATSELVRSKLENLKELVNAASQFVPIHTDLEMTPLALFLSHITLDAGDTGADPYEDAVQLMTLHSAKGLEFPFVIVCGLEEGLFPHKMSSHDPDRLEEERRLCYVGFTRAMQKLCITYATSRRAYNSEFIGRRSRFINEIPKNLLAEVRFKTKVSKPVFFQTTANFAEDEKPLYQIGQRVYHQNFGEGTVLDYEDHRTQPRVLIRFTQHGDKWLLATISKLSILK